ncbi:hypothetical protein [Halovulum dunhuangense]|uniref:hypothetical protein n=1 Tax=Halovulum dunhuangense TaxID=1505036 RepID=UPI001FE69583|nr:hypothetical protein [Halovulum dunhuangense]
MIGVDCGAFRPADGYGAAELLDLLERDLPTKPADRELAALVCQALGEADARRTIAREGGIQNRWSLRHAAIVIEHHARVSPGELDAVRVKLARAKGGEGAHRITNTPAHGTVPRHPNRSQVLEREWRRRPESNRCTRICNPPLLIENERFSRKRTPFVHVRISMG